MFVLHAYWPENQDERLGLRFKDAAQGAGAVISAVRPEAWVTKTSSFRDRPKIVSTPTAGMVALI